MRHKTCKGCDLKQSLQNFYRHSGMLDGYLSYCKACVETRVRKHRNKNIEAIRRYDRERGGLPHRESARAEYRKTGNYKLSHSVANKKYREKNPQKAKATYRVATAIRNGSIKRKPCQVCENVKSEAHHDDYDKPLNIRWLCDKHHKEWHKKQKEHTREQIS